MYSKSLWSPEAASVTKHSPQGGGKPTPSPDKCLVLRFLQDAELREEEVGMCSRNSLASKDSKRIRGERDA